ncbi:MAG: C39 family peptidase [Euryarchaeota archaeon]|nr:C39 family peptidase [Euryarchaeota archaeon]
MAIMTMVMIQAPVTPAAWALLQILEMAVTPLAAAMVVDYWYDKNGWSYPGKNALLDHLHHFMGTSYSGWTSYRKAENGIMDTTDELGHFLYAYNDWWVSWGDIKNEIDDMHPFVLNMTDGGHYGDHSVTGIGYLGGSSSGHVILYDGWNTWTHYLGYGNWGTPTVMTGVN